MSSMLTGQPSTPDPQLVDALTKGTFAAVDFETATYARASACSLAVVTVDDGQITSEQSWFIRPPDNRYYSFNTALHGIGPANTESSPPFDQVFPEAYEHIAGRPVIAHNAAFDIGVIRDEHVRIGASWPEMRIGCTLVLSRRAWRGLSSYALPSVAHFLGLDNFAHHDAAADARTCAHIARYLIAVTEAPDLDEVARTLGVNLGMLDPADYRSCHAKGYGTNGWGLLAPDPAEIDPDHPFAGAKVAFTGSLSSMTRQEAAQLLVNAGGEFTQGISRFTRYLVFGQQDFSKFVDGQKSAKTRRAEAIISNGHTLQIISEDDFLRMLG
ncbi:hypothetical protein EF847_22020 [Actinobacteria bacterium YIM 96077]|uniref:BRCT domain-containing protein n=1 Tax=Phytoactinopolyspora halophila TaxID=1981511 RepID=A0A329QSS0_9ACTN|nr:exonuclease domain-containing protein [Phytoactinopolyspora halophila]AYY14967.1 hypothetical protein EF847_22020 [Actinobacteria bacterium YIM 96077]RAW15424.1 hypothetical protein DPM12_09250 [Phytoactinopolyspora halophila]